MENKAKKNAQLNAIQRLIRYFGYVLPVLVLITFASAVTIGILYFTKDQEYIAKKTELKELKEKLKDYNSKKIELLAYSEAKGEYNAYINNQLNYDLIFRTMEKYIPKDTTRMTLRTKKKGNNVQVIVNTEIKGYDSYMSLLRVVDKCSFSTETEKKALLNIQKIEISENGEGDENLSESASINLAFNFNVVENKYILQKKYDLKLKEFQDVGKVVYFMNVSKDETKYPDIKQQNYFNTLKNFYTKKQNFAKKLAEVIKTDENGYYIVNTGENVIARTKTEIKLAELITSYYNDYKKVLEQEKAQIFDNGDIIYKKDKKTEIVVNLKEDIDKYLVEINKELLKLEIIKNYNKYLQKDNYLSTFERISKDAKKKYTLMIDGEKKEISAKEYITSLISQYSILTEDNPLIEASILKQEKKLNNGATVFTDRKPEDIDKEKKKIYTEMITFLKNIDKNKQKYLDANLYLDNFYRNEIRYNLYNEATKVIDVFFNKSRLDTDFMDAIKYRFFDFRIPTNISSYKKQFLLTIKNNKKLILKLSKIKNENAFVKELEELEDFIGKTTDIILAKNNNIDCIYKDVKMETKDIYKTILKDKQDEDEEKNKIKEVDLIIDSIDTK